MSADYTRLKGVSSVGQTLLSEQLEGGVLHFLSWAFLNASGYYNVQVPTSGAYGGDWHRLRPVKDPYYADGQVWQAFRQDWVWETGVDCTPGPIRVSGVFVDGTFRPSTGVGPHAHTINYPLGQVVFSSAISTGCVVTAEYSFRYFHLHAADADWWREIQFGSWRAENFPSSFGSGSWGVLAQNRIQLPAIVVEAVSNTSRHGLEMGSQTAVTRQDVYLHILAETMHDKRQLHDSLTYQWEKNFFLYDRDRVLASGLMPLDQNGSPASDVMYPDLIRDYAWRQVRVQNVQSVDLSNKSPLYHALVKWVCELHMP